MEPEEPSAPGQSLLGVRLLCGAYSELRRLRMTRGAHRRTARRTRSAIAALTAGAWLLAAPGAPPAEAAEPSFFSGLWDESEYVYGHRPAFGDIDGDGDLDAFVSGGLFAENTGSPETPVFSNPIEAAFGLTFSEAEGSPSLVDIDGDGDLDLVFGHGADLVFVRNSGTPSTPAFDPPQTNPFGLTSVGAGAAPTFFDLDNDGDADALVGNRDGDVLYFENSGTATTPAFSPPATNPFGLSNVGERAIPTAGDIDDDGDVDVFVGRRNGNLLFFQNQQVGTPLFATSQLNPFGLKDTGYDAAPALADLDGDGDLDAVVGRTDEGAVLFGNRGSAAHPLFDTPTPDKGTPFGLMRIEYEGNARFGDIDGDGDLDAVMGDYEGRTLLFRNGGTAQHPLFATGNPFGIGGDAHYPQLSFVDIDGDGDLDVFEDGDLYYDLVFFENIGSSATPKFAPPKFNPFGLPALAQDHTTFADIDGDGDFDAFANRLFFENTGSGSSPSFAEGVLGAFGLPTGGSREIAFADLDDDGDLDALASGYCTNVGSPTAPSFNCAGSLGIWGDRPIFADVDGDGDFDALSGQNEDVLFFENTGSTVSPSFAAAQTNPFGLVPVEDEHDASPSLADIDGDGDLDAFVGFSPGFVLFFENIGSPTSPAFSLGANDPFLVPRPYGRYYTTPALVDSDGDGDLDLFLGRGDGAIEFHENTGTPTSHSFAPEQINPFGLTPVNDWARPEFVDIDGDGDFDTFVGDAYGGTTFFENTGTSAAPAFGPGQMNPFGLSSVHYVAAPAFADLDEDGDFDAFIGQHYGEIIHFENIGSPTSPVFAPPIENPFGIGTVVYKKSSPTFADIDGDGDLDLFAGEYFGRISFSRNGISGAPGTGVAAFLEYKAKESDRNAPNGSLLSLDCNVSVDDPTFDFGDGKTSAEYYRASITQTIGLPAKVDAAGDADLEGTHLLGLLIRGTPKGALPAVAGKFSTTRKHERRTGVLVTLPSETLHDGSGTNTIRLDTKKETRLLVPAASSPSSVPSAPDDSTDHYKCYKVKASTTGGVGTLQDSKGKERKGLQLLIEDTFADGQGHARFGDARLFELSKATELCNPVATGNIDTTETNAQGEARKSDCSIPPREIERPATSLLCWKTRLARIEIPQPAGSLTPSPISPRQEKHEKRKLKTGNPVHVGHQLDAPDRVDTSRESQVCLPAIVTNRGIVKP